MDDYALKWDGNYVLTWNGTVQVVGALSRCIEYLTHRWGCDELWESWTTQYLGGIARGWVKGDLLQLKLNVEGPPAQG